MSTALTLDELLAQLADPDQEKRINAIRELAERRSLRAVKPMMQARLRRSPEEQAILLQALKDMGAAILPALNTIFLKDVSIALRSDAAYVLGEIGHEDSIRVLARGVHMAPALVRSLAVAALGKFTTYEEPLQYLLAALDDDVLSVRIEGAIALGKRGDVRAVRILTQAIEQQWIHPNHLPLIMAALACTDDPRALDVIVDVYENFRDRPLIRLAAIESLADMGDRRVETALRMAQADPDPDIQAAATAALETRTG